MFESMNESLFQLMEIVTEDFAQLAELKTAIKRETPSGVRVFSAESLRPTPACFDFFRGDVEPAGQLILELNECPLYLRPQLPMTEEIEQCLLEFYGAPNRRDWAVNKWGMPTDFFDVEPWDVFLPQSIRFRTLYTVPDAIYEVLSKRFGNLTLHIRWVEEQGMRPAFSFTRRERPRGAKPSKSSARKAKG
jgi:hypothetical protein